MHKLRQNFSIVIHFPALRCCLHTVAAVIAWMSGKQLTFEKDHTSKEVAFLNSYVFFITAVFLHRGAISAMGWLRLVGSIKLQVSFAKEPYKRDNILPKRPIVLSILLTVATPYIILSQQLVCVMVGCGISQKPANFLHGGTAQAAPECRKIAGFCEILPHTTAHTPLPTHTNFHDSIQAAPRCRKTAIYCHYIYGDFCVCHYIDSIYTYIYILLYAVTIYGDFYILSPYIDSIYTYMYTSIYCHYVLLYIYMYCRDSTYDSKRVVSEIDTR